ncbi:MAG: MaoC family dehydratase [Rubrivivax sp.]
MSPFLGREAQQGHRPRPFIEHCAQPQAPAQIGGGHPPQRGVQNTTLVGVDAADLRVGLRLRAVFDERPGAVTLLRFTPEEGAHPGVMKAETQAEAALAEEPAEAAGSAAAAPPKRQIDCRDLDALRSLISDEFSPWSNEFMVSQDVINQFAALTGDDYWIHTDPERARAQSPFGTTIAHGALVQVLVSRLKLPLDWEVTGFNNMVNYGSDRLRFATPVPSGCRIRARARVKAVERVKSGTQLTMEIDTHVVGQDRPSVVNDIVILYM